MKTEDKKYIILIAIHVLLGVLIFLFRPIASLYSAAILLLGIYYVLKSGNKNNEVLFVSAYIVGSEVFLRMTGGSILYEFSKYGVMIFLLFGMFYSGFSKNAVPFWIYLLLLLPGVIVATETLNLQTDLRTSIAFNISGPVCLGIASIYNYNRKITFSQLNNILLTLGLPIVTTMVYLVLYTPDLKEVLTGTGSNGETSGGFGPNQVATILGIGMFIFFSRLIFNSKNKLIFILNLIIATNITYRGLVTFSRGGMITGFVMIVILLIFLYFNSASSGKYKLNMLFVFMSVVFIFTWLYTSMQTSGLIDKRYANQDAMGRVKESRFTGREEILASEIDAFMDSPILGIGVAKGLEIRYEKTGEIVTSHNEISRTIAEHGMLGIIALMIVFFTPVFLYLDNKQHVYIFCFLIFWLLTINHAAMRIAAPAFVYSLSLLKVSFDKTDL
ncbi:O-antigen ligase domain-containing protein [Flavobacterium silvisoli]|uniref:O-antigen ligase domain-containing protein n=1 Tax=Flavobacterium silvisoli TaxID=2529433 RepID=A0A4Q9YZT7_9FLAO|nr:O-antigen ligase family protein [Flavobacterium silvisoli]TBX69239.1 O-antigen ligase domain-containing protein [Flavobacterium silvisoli]